MKPYFSIVIPYHNSQATIGKLLESLAQSKRAPSFEVIVADDGSDEAFVRSPGRIRGKQYDLQSVRFATNRGPAAARNAGAARARGQYLIFMDSDVEVFPDTLYQIAKIFTTDPDVVALAGVWAKSQRGKAFFPNFKALRDWSYWINEREAGAYYYIFSTRIAAIKEAVFRRLGGFDESYKAALG